MATSNVIPLQYEGQAYSFNAAGWINATEAAKRFGKEPAQWLRLPETKAYLLGLERRYGEITYVETSRARMDRGGGTWLHPRLAVPFARWLSIDFEIWCDEQIDRLIHGGAENWQLLRDSAAIGYRGMCDALQLTREAQGKPAARHHFINEARLINIAVFGQAKGVDRDSLSPAELRLLALIEQRDTFLLGRGLDYQQRKQELTRYAQEQLIPKLQGGAA
ncbi:KilA-N domain-containing protein [Vreelandella titanicae]|uniref:KilA-N domain-containing protein n=1 Tax=Vreelandella titanicae TaxID=664683 RepID=UPI003CFBD05E|tara:strand:- start:1163 stop:1822 length:660 start_codon:yes stop_codon:yes gene_type:complete